MKKGKGLDKSEQMNGVQLARGRTTSGAAVNSASQIKVDFFVEANAYLDQIYQANYHVNIIHFILLHPKIFP